MAINVINDTIESASITEDARGKSAVRRIILEASGQEFSGGSGTGNADGTGTQKLWNILETSGNVPIIGDPYPADITMTLSQREVRAISTRIMEVVLQYRLFQNADAKIDSLVTFGLSAGLRSVQTNYDINGDVMFVTNSDTGESQVITANVDLPVLNLSITRRMSVNFLPNSKDWTGKLNTDAYNPGLGDNKLGIIINSKEARCEGINISTDDRGLSYIVDYSFSIIPLGQTMQGPRPIISGLSNDPWDYFAHAMDESTGRPVFDPVPGAEVDTFTIYESRLFNWSLLFG